jgi:hypothetical protein
MSKGEVKALQITSLIENNHCIISLNHLANKETF